MKLPRDTFGNKPAAQYLIDKLNQLDNTSVLKSVSVAIINNNKQLNELYQSYLDNLLTAKTFANVLRLMRNEATKFKLSLEDKTIENLTKNVLIGKIKYYIRLMELANKAAWVMDYPEKRGVLYHQQIDDNVITNYYSFYDHKFDKYINAGFIKQYKPDLSIISVSKF